MEIARAVGPIVVHPGQEAKRRGLEQVRATIIVGVKVAIALSIATVAVPAVVASVFVATTVVLVAAATRLIHYITR